MIRATKDELLDMIDYLYWITARLDIAAPYLPEHLPNEAALCQQLVSCGQWMIDAGGGALPVLTPEEVKDELYFPPEPITITEESHACLES